MIITDANSAGKIVTKMASKKMKNKPKLNATVLVVESSSVKSEVPHLPTIVSSKSSPQLDNSSFPSPIIRRLCDSLSCSSFEFDEESIRMPKKLLYDDYICSKPASKVDLKGWFVCGEAFEYLGRPEFRFLSVLNLDFVTGLEKQHLRLLRGHGSMKRLSLVSCKVLIDREIAEIFGSFKSLQQLNLSECSIDSQVLNVMSNACATLKVLNLSSSKGVDNFQMQSLAKLIARYRTLEMIDLSRSFDFEDEGLLDVVQTGARVLLELKINGCKQLTTLALASIRSKMSLKHLEMSNLIHLGLTAYEWISEGCRNLTYLDLSKSPELTDDAIMRISQHCSSLEVLLLSECLKITDNGMKVFFENFSGRLRKLDMNGCVQCGDGAMSALSSKASELCSLSVNGMSKITANVLTALWNNAPKLSHFDMSCELRATTSHR